MRRENPSVFVLFLLDTSDSMGAMERMAVTKAAVLALLQRAYQSRHTVSLISFGGQEAKIVLRPSKSVLLAKKALSELRPDGGTPLAAGLRSSVELLRRSALRFPSGERRLVIISDGEATVSDPSSPGRGGKPFAQAALLARELSSLSVEPVYIDTKRPAVGKENEMRRLQRLSGGRYLNASAPGLGTILEAIEG